jgi:hypothetical protein
MGLDLSGFWKDNLLPLLGGSSDIGSPGSPWRTLYAQNLVITGNSVTGLVGTVREMGGTTVSPVSTLEFDPAQGFVVSGPGGQVARVQLSQDLRSTASPTFATLNLSGNLRVSGAGPHFIGGALDAASHIKVGSGATFTVAGSVAGLDLALTLAPGAGGDAAGMMYEGTINKAGSGTHADFIGVQLYAPIIGAGAATLTNATTLKIMGAPASGTNRYALWVAAGNIRFAGNIGGLADPSKGSSILFDSTLLVLRSGTTGIQFMNQADSIERMRLTDGGVLALGTTVVTSAGAGDLVLPNATGEIRGVNAAGTDTVNLVSLTAADLLKTRLWTWPAADGVATQVLQTDGAGNLSFGWREFTSADQTVTINSTLNVAHGLGGKPKLVYVVLKNTTTEFGFAVGDEIDISSGGNNGSDFPPSPGVAADATNVAVTTGPSIQLIRRDTFVSGVITTANWRYVVRAWR